MDQFTPKPPPHGEREKAPPATPQKSVISERQKPRPTPRFYQFEQVNEVTIKMTDGSLCLVEGAMGAANYKSTRALGYLMEIGGAWVACVGQRRSEPLTLAKAKAVARDMHRDEGLGTDHPDKIRALNLAAAQLVDRAARRERASRMKPTDWPHDLMGGQRQCSADIDPELRRAILDVELDTAAPELARSNVDLKPSPLDGKLVLPGDDYPLEYDENGYPELPAFLDRRTKPTKE
jgi:hypothetical protein